MSRAMIVVRLLAMVAAGSLSCVAALLAITSLAGGRDARADTAAWSHGMRRQDRMLAPLRRWTIAWFTWPARAPNGNLAWRLPLLPIDHIYAGPAWGQVRLRRVPIPGSDHFATEAAFCLERAEPTV